MVDRKGEHSGWTWGWIGGFLWVPVIALVFLAHGRLAEGGIGLLIFIAAILATRQFAPWRHPVTPFWRLFLGPYLLFLLTIPWAVWGFGGFGDEQLESWMLLWLLPTLIPVLTNGRKTWSEGGRD